MTPCTFETPVMGAVRLSTKLIIRCSSSLDEATPAAMHASRLTTRLSSSNPTFTIELAKNLSKRRWKSSLPFSNANVAASILCARKEGRLRIPSLSLINLIMNAASSSVRLNPNLIFSTATFAQS